VAAKNQRVSVTRAFRRAGEDVGVGSVIDLDLPTAQELRNARKVEFVPSDTKAVVVPFKPKDKRPAQPDQLAALIAQVAALTAEVASLKSAKPAVKEKASA
jgi:hypothetical protein